MPKLLDGVAQHLARHHAKFIATRYLKFLESTIAYHR
jgi:hypothetical protein